MRMKMNRLINIMVCALLVLVFAGCSDKETERKLTGSWVGVTTDDSEGVPVEIAYRLDLNGSNKMKMTMSVSMMGFSDIMTFSYKGGWKADTETIWLDVDGGLDVRIDSGLELLANMIGVSTSELKRELRREFESEMTGFSYMDIVKLSADELVVEEDGERVYFSRARDSEYSGSSEASQATESCQVEGDCLVEGDYLSEVSEPSAPEYVTLRGKIGGKYPVEMQLDVSDLSDISGRYRYTASGSGYWLDLKGDIYKQHLSMKEYNEKGECSGSWEGECFDAEDSGWSFSGTMTNYAGKTFQVSLNQ